MTNIVQNAEAVLERLVDPILGVDFKTAKMIRAVDLQASTRRPDPAPRPA